MKTGSAARFNSPPRCAINRVMIVDIISDVVCPWCFVGKRRFERALAVRPEIDAKISWHAFQLNPDMPAEGMDRVTYLAEKFGSDERAEAIYADIAEAGKGENIAFAFDRIPRTPNTIDAHRVIRLAGIHGVQDGVVEAMFHGYFENGADISDNEQLAVLAAKGGLDVDLTKAHLASDDRREGGCLSLGFLLAGGCPCGLGGSEKGDKALSAATVSVQPSWSVFRRDGPFF